MPIRLGETEPTAVYLGDTEIDAMYLGETEIYSAATPLDPADGIRLTSAGAIQFGFGLDAFFWYGYARSEAGAIANSATSRVSLIGQSRGSWHVHVAWDGQPTSGTVYARWRPNSGADVDFDMTYENRRIANRQITGFSGDDEGIAGYNAASGLPTGTLYLFSDAARTQIISMRTGG